MAGPVTGMRPLVGVTGSTRGGRFMWWFNSLAVRRAGGRPVRITPARPFPVQRLDALVIGGGDDIEPSVYGLGVAPSIRIDPARDAMELRLLDEAHARGLPVLGICRGAQMINVHAGGTLHQDIHAVYEDAPRLRTVLPRKLVEIEPDSRLRALLCGLACCKVNALHHQSVDRLGQGLHVAARDQHGIVQAIESRDGGFLVGVQWHPEFLALDQCQQSLFAHLVEWARHRLAGHENAPADMPPGRLDSDERQPQAERR